MASYPSLSTLPNEPLDRGWKDSTLISDTDADYIRTRARNSRLPKTFGIHYRLMKDSDYQTLEAFFEARMGSSEAFTWTHPITSVNYTVRFLKDTFKSEKTAVGRWNINFTLEEV
ncbi:MAG: hypothetical protein ABIJ17_02540 [Patescibacteria group bacterium]